MRAMGHYCVRDGSRRGTLAGRGVRVVVYACAMLVTSAFALRAGADATHLVILRAGANGLAGASEVGAVDEALLETLRKTHGNLVPYFSAVPYDDVQLLSSCDTSEGECLHRVANAMSHDWVLVRRLSSAGSNELELTLFAQDGGGEARPRSARAILPQGDIPALQARVRQLVLDLYGDAPSRVHSPSHDRGPVSSKERRERLILRSLGWSSLGAGVTLVSSGLVLRVMSQRSYDDYAAQELQTRDDADRAARLWRLSRRRTDSANRCFIAGAAFVVVSAGVLVWDLVRSGRDREPNLTMGATPLRGGMALSISGRFERNH